MKTIARYKKAIAGLVGPAVVTFVYAVQAGSPGGSSVTGGEWALIVVAALGTGGAVAAAPKNRDSRNHTAASTQPTTTGK